MLAHIHTDCEYQKFPWVVWTQDFIFPRLLLFLFQHMAPHAFICGTISCISSSSFVIIILPTLCTESCNFQTWSSWQHWKSWESIITHLILSLFIILTFLNFNNYHCFFEAKNYLLFIFISLYLTYAGCTAGAL